MLLDLTLQLPSPSPLITSDQRAAGTLLSRIVYTLQRIPCLINLTMTSFIWANKGAVLSASDTWQKSSFPTCAFLFKENDKVAGISTIREYKVISKSQIISLKLKMAQVEESDGNKK